MNVDRVLARLSLAPDDPKVDVASLALHLARDNYPDLRLRPYFARIGQLARGCGPRLAPCQSLLDRVIALGDYLFGECGFSGNRTAYYDPRNSYLHEVLDRRLGIPITLCVLTQAVGARLGLDLRGAALPGHFILKAVDLEAGEEILFDPFNNGQILTRDMCADLVKEATGRRLDPAELEPHLTPASPSLVVTRMLNNLKVIYLRQEDFPRAAKIISRLCQLHPDNLDERRDLGVCLLRVGQPGKALDQLLNYVSGRPEAEDAVVVRSLLGEARRQLARWN